MTVVLGFAPVDRDAILTSRHPAYETGEAIDLTMWVRAGVEIASLDLRVVDGDGQPVAERAEKRQELDETLRMAAIPGTNARVAIPDLHRWFAIDAAGDYAARLVSPGGDRIVATLSFPIRASIVGEVVPLDRVWALDMPGTRPMNRTRTGEPAAYEAPEGPLVDEVRAALGTSRDRGVPGPGFAVPGEGLEALRMARDVIARGEPRPGPAEFADGGPVTLVFFSRESSVYVHLAGVDRRGDDIQIRYRFVPHRTKEMTSHLALVPLPAGSGLPKRVAVKPVIDPGAEGLDWADWSARFVCGSFTMNP